MKKYKIIDAHCHIYPEKIAQRAVAGTDNFYKAKSLCLGTSDDLVKIGTSAGVDHFVVQSVATSPLQVRRINAFIAQKVSESDGKFTGLGTLHPDSRDIDGDIEDLLELGLKGVKLHPDIQNFKIDDHRNLTIYEKCEEKNIPILMHTGDKRFDNSNPNRLLPIMQIYTGLTVVAAHLGGWSVWDSAAELLPDLDNLYFDTCSCFEFTDKEHVKKLIELYGTGKVLFGTDYPMFKAHSEIENMLSLGFTDEDYEKIFSLNAMKVFNIK